MRMATKTPNQIVSENVETLRRIKGLSQETIGKALGKSQSQADRKLKAVSPWNADEIALIAGLLGVTEEFLFQEQTYPN